MSGDDGETWLRPFSGFFLAERLDHCRKKKYRFLLVETEGLTTPQLDERVEAWIQQSCDRAVDFEVDDAVDKLRRLDLVHGDATLRARPVSQALVELDRRWDDLFSPEAPPDLGRPGHFSCG